jgi:uncharacterized membrane protein (UPF0127 family)
MEVIIKNQKFDAEVMETPEEIQKGMMGRNNLNGCMVFNIKKGYHSFWMKNCLIPLDIVFVLNSRISKIHHGCQPCDGECDKSYTGIGDKVIEFPSGTSKNWSIGDKVSFY